MLTREELKNAHDNVMTIMENRIMQMCSCDRATANLIANEVLTLDRESEELLKTDSDTLSDDQLRKIEYHEGYYAAGNNIPFDEDQTEAWKEGWHDGYQSIYGDDDLDDIENL